MVKKADPYKIVKRGDGRYEITKRGGGRINGPEKLKILVDAGLVKLPTPKKKEEAPAAES